MLLTLEIRFNMMRNSLNGMSEFIGIEMSLFVNDFFEWIILWVNLK